MDTQATLSEPTRLTSVNTHYLDQVVQLSRSKSVVAHEDIFDARGLKIIAKGTQVDENVYERLIRFKLRKPLESTISVDGGVGPADLCQLAEELSDVYASVVGAFSMGKRQGLVANLLQKIKIDGPSSLFLSLQQEQSNLLQHSLLVAMVAVGAGAGFGLGNDELQSVLMAGVFHDVGVLYIDPAIQNRALSPSEWRHLASHPLIGEMVVQDTTNLPPAVSKAIGEHHERMNGFGYPRGTKGNKISRPGSLLLTAEAISGIVGTTGVDTLRIAHALKLVTGDFPQDVVSHVINAYQAIHDQLGIEGSFRLQGDVLQRTIELSVVILRAKEWLEAQVGLTKQVLQLADLAMGRLNLIFAALNSTGICQVENEETSGLPKEDQIELDTIAREIKWRLAELSRVVWMKAIPMGEQALDFAKALDAHLVPSPAPEETPRASLNSKPQ